MNKLFPLSKDRYGEKYWQRTPDWHFAADKALVPVVTLELPRAVGQMPLAFIAHNDGFVLVAVLGTEPNSSLAVDSKGQWRSGHFPALLSTYPFCLVDRDAENQAVYVDEGSGLIGSDPSFGEPFFDDSGNPGPKVLEVVDFLKKIAASRMATRRAVDALAAARLLDPWDIQVPTPHGNTSLKGLYYVNEARLRALEPATVKRLLDAGALVVAYGQLFSMTQIHLLSRWAQDYQPSDISMDQIFGDGDLLRFD